MPKNPFILAPSILSADFARLGEDVAQVLASGADWVHFDVMDNHYVPNLTIGPMVCKALRDYGIQAPIDVHLMVKPVDRLLGDFIEAGATSLSIHPEATEHLDLSLRRIKEAGCQAFLALNPATPLHWMDEVMEHLDGVLLMSVNPGFGGQAFIPRILKKIAQARAKIDASGQPLRLQVDGGIGLANIADLAAAGADTFVAGSAIFGQRRTQDPQGFNSIIHSLRLALASEPQP